MEAMRPSVWRSARRNTARSVSAVAIATPAGTDRRDRGLYLKVRAPPGRRLRSVRRSRVDPHDPAFEQMDGRMAGRAVPSGLSPCC
jgi:hypothetical protein